MISKYFEPLFRLILARRYKECEQSIARILEEQEGLSETDRKLLDIFGNIKGRLSTKALFEELKSARDVFRESGSFEGIFLTARFIADHYCDRGFFGLANEYFEECLKYGNCMDDKYLSVIFAGLAKNYVSSFDSVSTVPESFPEYGTMAIEKAGDDPLLLAVAYISYGYELWIMHLWDDLLAHAQKLDTLLNKEGLSDLRMFVHEEYVQSYIGLKNYPKAIEYAKAMY
jgi:hypothetical protein